MYKLQETLKEDIFRFRILVKEYKKKKIEPILFKSFRVQMGIYEQRQDEVYMVRIRSTGGVIYPEQFSKLIEITLNSNSRLLHITTRQEIQIHNLQLEEIFNILLELQKIQLITKGVGGNTVRNIIVSYGSGISKDEVFDTTPYAIALTNKLVLEEKYCLLPRKMKIAFSSNEKYIDYAVINDLGFVAKIKSGKKGFQVYIGGGGGINPSIGLVLFDFIYERDLFIVTESVIKMFSEYGNYENKHKARIRYIVFQLGIEKVFDIVNKYYKEAKKKSIFVPIKEATYFLNQKHCINSNCLIQEKKYKIWEKRYVTKQKQIGYVSVIIPFEFGNILLDNKIFVKSVQDLLNFVSQYGKDTIRFTTSQNIQLRNIPNYVLQELYILIKKIIVEPEIPLLLNNIVSCTGADTCRLGICLSKQLAMSIKNELKNSKLNLDELYNIRIHISGCHNSCGQQLLSDIGFSGKILKNNRIYPGYRVYLAADRRENPKLAEPIGNIAARDVPSYIIDLLSFYLKNRLNGQSFTDFINKEAKEHSIRILNKYQKIPSIEEDRNYYCDWGEKSVFTLVKNKLSECSSSLLDMIKMNLKSIKEAKEILKVEKKKENINKQLYNILYFSSHMLLLTKGIEVKTKKDVFYLFLKHFCDKDLINEKYIFLIEALSKCELLDISLHKKQVYSFLDIVMNLYKKTNNCLKYKKTKFISEINNDLYRKKKKEDLRGLTCPMNFLRIKIQLSQMNSEDELEVWLDGDSSSIDTVSLSVKSEGHKILDQIKMKNYWKLIIKKK